MPAVASTSPEWTSGAANTLTQIHQDEVLTGEAVALDVQPIGFFLRALGTFIDVLIGVAFFVLLTFVVSWGTGVSFFEVLGLPIVAIALLVTVMVIVPTVVETVTRGRSLGKLAVGGRIVRADGGASGFRQSFIRALVGVFEIWFTVGAVAAMVGAFTPRSQRLGDLMAGTYSERTRTPALPAPAPGIPPALAPWAGVADVARLPEPLSRRVAQFARHAGDMQPAARTRIAASLAREVSEFVSPVPAVDAELFLHGVVAVRRDRELRALQLEEQRVTALASGRGEPRDFPQR